MKVGAGGGVTVPIVDEILQRQISPLIARHELE
jgi:hypothetical protein